MRQSLTLVITVQFSFNYCWVSRPRCQFGVGDQMLLRPSFSATQRATSRPTLMTKDPTARLPVEYSEFALSETSFDRIPHRRRLTSHNSQYGTWTKEAPEAPQCAQPLALGQTVRYARHPPSHHSQMRSLEDTTTNTSQVLTLPRPPPVLTSSATRCR